MKYDDASWHCGGNFPAELPPEAGATHIAMFLAWALLHGLVGDLHRQESADGLLELKARVTTAGQFFLRYCDGKFTDEDLNELGNRFAKAYYDGDESLYLSDYEASIGDAVPTLYHAADSWLTYGAIEPVLDGRFAAWRVNAG